MLYSCRMTIAGSGLLQVQLGVELYNSLKSALKSQGGKFLALCRWSVSVQYIEMNGWGEKKVALASLAATSIHCLKLVHRDLHV